MFERFTDKCIHVLMIAQKEARRLGHNRVGTEQILVGLAREQRSPASYWLESVGMPVMEVQAKVEALIGRGNDFPELAPPFSFLAGLINAFRPMPFTENAISLIELATDKADGTNSKNVEPHHLLLAILNLHQSRAARLLAKSGVQLTALERKVLSSMTAVH